MGGKGKKDKKHQDKKHQDKTHQDKKNREGSKDTCAPPSSPRALGDSSPRPIEREDYRAQLYELQVELVKLQRHVIEHGLKLLLVFEGRDAAGKDGCIKRLTRHMSPRDTRIHAPTKPTERDAAGWYFQRFTPHLPIAGEIVIFNRSWYNRAGVERVMDFCTDEDVERFLRQVPVFEELLIQSGVLLIKLYLDISRDTQKERLDARRQDPLKRWKISPVDEKALGMWEEYTEARDDMLRRTHTVAAPWTIVEANDKRAARLALIRHVLSRVEYADRCEDHLRPDSQVLYPFDMQVLEEGRLSS